MNLNWITRLMAFYRFGIAGEGGGGEVLDRGDDFTPTDEVEEETPASKKAAAKLVDELKDDKKDDPEDENEEESESEDEETANAKKTGKKDTRIPLARHKEILAKERAQREQLVAENAKLKQGQQVAVTNEEITKAEDKLIGLETDYAKLVTDGDAAKAAATMTEIRKLERSISETKTTLLVQASESRAVERVQYDSTVERLEASYPELNPDHADYDKEKTGEVVELRDAYLATGKYTRAAAIQKAVKTLLGAETTRQERAVETDVRVDKEAVAKAAAEERRKAQAKKNADTATKQPPNTKDVGLDSDKMGGRVDAKTVMKMSQDEFAKLNDADLARMRGDEL